MPHPNTFAKNGLTKPKNPFGELSDQMSQSRLPSSSSSSSSSSPAKRNFQTNQNTVAFHHPKPVSQTKTLDYVPAAPKIAGKRRLQSTGNDHKTSKRHKADLEKSQMIMLRNKMKDREVTVKAQGAHARSKALVEPSQRISPQVVPPNSRGINVEPSPNKPVKKVITRATGTQTQLVSTTTVAMQTNTDRNGSTDSKSDFDTHRESLHDNFQMLMKQMKIYALKRFEDRGVPAEEINQHVSSLLGAFKLADNDSCLMTHTWNFMVAIEGARKSQEFLLDKCKETFRSVNVMEFVKTHTHSWEDKLWGQLSRAVNCLWRYGNPPTAATGPVIIKQEPAENENPTNQRDCNFNDEAVFSQDFIPEFKIKEERTDDNVIDYNHGSTAISFNPM